MGELVGIDPDLEIDTDLFVKCRLCVEENGSFQIHPVVQEQIKYCFDITVKHLDCLPQLMCKKCKSILTEFYGIKKKFLENQDKLLQKLNEAKLAQNKTINEKVVPEDNKCVTNNNIVENGANEEAGPLDDSEDNFVPKLQIKRRRIISTSSSTSVETKTKKQKKKKSLSWKMSYEKKFMCKYCKAKFSKKEQIHKHVNTQHLKLISICNKLSKGCCFVRMERVDNQFNLTGQNKSVVLNPRSILWNSYKKNYFVKYVPLNHTSTTDTDEPFKETTPNILDKSLSDVEENLKNKPRIRSRSSSNETVVIEDQKQVIIKTDLDEPHINGKEKLSDQLKDKTVVSEPSKNVAEIQCIELDDSSTESNEENEFSFSNKDIKTIQDITSQCYKKYLKNSNNSVSDDVLKHKFLSTGRKFLNISNKSISTPGVLKYLEQKYVPVEWIFPKKSEISTPYARLLARIKDSITDDIKWKPCQINKFIHSDQNELENGQNLTPNNDQSLACLSSVKSCNSVEDVGKNKLLNASPVANPKQLPKKALHSDTKSIHTYSAKPYDVEDKMYDDGTQMEFNTVNLENQSMPIISTTESLAPNKETNTAAPQESIEKQRPIIKCKPVSELMGTSNSTLTKYQMQENISTGTNNINENDSGIVNDASKQNIFGLDYGKIVIHSVDLPNSSTLNPIQYLKCMLQMHSITLISQVKYELNKDFVCLVRFWLDVSMNNQSIVLNLALYANNNSFCLKLKNVSEEMDIDVLPPHWQAHILKSFGGEVAEKILQCASKTSQLLYNYTKQFVALLKNIEFKTASKS